MYRTLKSKIENTIIEMEHTIWMNEYDSGAYFFIDKHKTAHKYAAKLIYFLTLHTQRYIMGHHASGSCLARGPHQHHRRCPPCHSYPSPLVVVLHCSPNRTEAQASFYAAVLDCKLLTRLKSVEIWLYVCYRGMRWDFMWEECARLKIVCSVLTTRWRVIDISV